MIRRVPVPYRILLVDEDYDIRTALVFLVSKAKGCSLHVASPLEAINQESVQFDPNILLYAHRPSADDQSPGWVEIRDRFPSAYLILLLPEFDSAQAKTYSSAGARDVLYKEEGNLTSIRRSLVRAFQQTVDPAPPMVDLKQITGHFQSGDKVLHYRILEEMDQTGWNEIYRAEDVNSGRTVVLKLLNPTIWKNERHKIRQQPGVASGIRQTGLAAVGSAEEIGGMVLVAQEYVEGEDLRSVVWRETLGLMRTLEAGLQITEILTSLHKSGISHGNLKPANVILSPYGSIKLTDPGMTRRIPGVWKQADHAAAVSSLQKSGILTETVRYMAPEQLVRNQSDFRSDIFSLGCILYHAATGIPPFSAADAVSLIRAICTKEPLPPSEIQPHLPEALDRLLGIAMAKDPKRRFESVAAMAEKLEALRASFLDRSGSVLPGQAPEEKLVVDLEILEESITLRQQARKRRRLLGTSLFGVLIILGLIVGARFYQNIPKGKPLPSLAIIPSVTEAGSPETITLVEGITEAVIRRFSRLSGLRVIQPETALRYSRNVTTPQDVSRLTNTDSVLTIRISPQEESRTSIHVELFQKEKGEPVWTSQYNIQTTTLSSTLNRIVREAAKNLQIQIDAKSEARFRKEFLRSSESERAYLMARALSYKGTREDLQQSIAMYGKAATADPGNVWIFAGLAETWLALAIRGEDPEDAYSRARMAAFKALEIDAALPEAHAVLGAVHLFWDWNLSSAEKQLRQAIAGRPNLSPAHLHLAFLLTATGKSQEAYEELRQATSMDPLSISLNDQTATLLVHLHRYNDALRQSEKCMELGSNSVHIQQVVGDAYLGKGMNNEALLAYRHLEQVDSPEAPAKLALVLAASGMKTEAFALLKKAESTSGGQSNPEFLAAAYARLGDYDHAFQWLEQALENRSPDLLLLNNDAQFETLKTDPRFSRLLRRIGSRGSRLPLLKVP